MIGTALAIAFWVALVLLVRHEAAADRCAEPLVTITTAPDSVPVTYEETP